MALDENETFGTVVPGFVTDDDGRLVVSDAAGAEALANQQRWIAAGAVESVVSNTSPISAQTLTTAKLRVTGLAGPLKAGTAYTGIRIVTSSTGSTTLTHSWACLVDLDTMKVLRSSADITSEWASLTARQFVLSSYTPSADVLHPGFGLCVVASGATPTILGLNSNSSLMPAAPYPGLLDAGTYSTPLADGTDLSGIPAGTLLAGLVT